LDSLKLVDFGLAAVINSEKLLYPKCGTPGYVAPEVMNYTNKVYSEKCDLFSVGVIMHKM
jgi:serine/threonine protein kinase